MTKIGEQVQQASTANAPIKPQSNGRFQLLDVNFNNTRELANKAPSSENTVLKGAQKAAYLVASVFVAIAEVIANIAKVIANAGIFSANKIHALVNPKTQDVEQQETQDAGQQEVEHQNGANEATPAKQQPKNETVPASPTALGSAYTTVKEGLSKGFHTLNENRGVTLASLAGLAILGAAGYYFAGGAATAAGTCKAIPTKFASTVADVVGTCAINATRV